MYKSVEQQIAELQTQMDTLQQQKAELDKLEKNQRLAIELHGEFCTHNHSDYCSWEYEITQRQHNWNGSTHQRWVKKADELLELLEKRNVPLEVAMEFLRFSNELN